MRQTLYVEFIEENGILIKKRQKVSLSRTIEWVVGVYVCCYVLSISFSFYKITLTEKESQQLKILWASSLCMQEELLLFIKRYCSSSWMWEGLDSHMYELHKVTIFSFPLPPPRDLSSPFTKTPRVSSVGAIKTHKRKNTMKASSVRILWI